MPPKGWKKNPLTGEWYDPIAAGEVQPASDEASPAADDSASEEKSQFEEELVEVEEDRERGQSLTKTPAKQRKFQEGN